MLFRYWGSFSDNGFDIMMLKFVLGLKLSCLACSESWVAIKVKPVELRMLYIFTIHAETDITE